MQGSRGMYVRAWSAGEGRQRLDKGWTSGQRSYAKAQTTRDGILITKAMDATLSPGTSVNLPKFWIETVSAWARDNLSTLTFLLSQHGSRQSLWLPVACTSGTLSSQPSGLDCLYGLAVLGLPVQKIKILLSSMYPTVLENLTATSWVP